VLGSVEAVRQKTCLIILLCAVVREKTETVAEHVGLSLAKRGTQEKVYQNHYYQVDP
jgi:hypothetical protein